MIVEVRQVTNDFTSDDNDKRGRNTYKNKGGGNQYTNFGKMGVLSSGCLLSMENGISL